MMAFISVTLVSVLISISGSLCFLLRLSNNTGLATWYGPLAGARKGVACGWEGDVNDPPYNAMVASGSSTVFLNGKGCGHCFQIHCSRKPHCSGKPVNVTIVDKCSGICDKVPYHFDLTGYAFGLMAIQGHDFDLRLLGQVDIEFKRVPCHYGATKIAFKVGPKTNQTTFMTAIEYINGDGALSRVEIAPSGAHDFSPMDNVWGAVWKKDINASFKAPFSIRLTSANGKTLVASNVIPENYSAGHKYSTNVNFD